jgi:hypothetical protein
MLRAKGFGLVSNMQLPEPDRPADQTPEPATAAAASGQLTSGSDSWGQQLVAVVRSRPSSGGSWSEQLEKMANKGRPLSGGSWAEQLEKAAMAKGRPLSGGSWKEQLDRATGASGRPEIGPPILINTTLGPLALENHKCISVAGNVYFSRQLLHSL